MSSAHDAEESKAPQPPSGEEQPPVIPGPTTEAANQHIAEEPEEDDFEGETFTISEDVMTNLLTMGFSENAVKKAISCGCIDEDTCSQWINMHADHPELNTPLADNIRVIVKVKRVLTEAEREAKINEMKEKIKHNREEGLEKQKQEDLESERKRIENQRKLQETKRNIEQARKDSDMAELKRQREADVVARKKIRLQLLIDKYVRHGKTPEEAAQLAEAEFEEAAQKKREEAAALLEEAKQKQHKAAAEGAAPASAPSTGAWNLSALISDAPDEGGANSTKALFDQPIPPTTLESFRTVVADMKAAHPDGGAQQTLSVLRTILTNVQKTPMDSKKRMLKTTTTTFLTRIRPIPQAITFLRMCRFEQAYDGEGNELLTMNVLVTRDIAAAMTALE